MHSESALVSHWRLPRFSGDAYNLVPLLRLESQYRRLLPLNLNSIATASVASKTVFSVAGPWKLGIEHWSRR